MEVADDDDDDCDELTLVQHIVLQLQEHVTVKVVNA